MVIAMNLFVEILTSFTKKHHSKDDKANYIFYKIVDSDVTHENFVLQCINTKAIFRSKISEIVFDTDILYGLHPIQACYIGIEYSKYLKSLNTTQLDKNQVKAKLNKYSVHRYGSYILTFQNRTGEVGFVNHVTNDDFLMDPRDIALSEELIAEFDAAQAFYIGLLAGLKLNNPVKQLEIDKKYQKPHLVVVK